MTDWNIGDPIEREFADEMEKPRVENPCCLGCDLKVQCRLVLRKYKRRQTTKSEFIRAIAELHVLCHDQMACLIGVKL
jgi:hypothetical protein